MSISIRNNSNKLNISSLRFGSVKSSDNGDIDSNSSDANLSVLLSEEISNRILGDVSLSGALSSEISTRILGDISLSGALSSEISNRVSGDISLSLRVNSLNSSLINEMSTRTSVDASIILTVESIANNPSGVTEEYVKSRASNYASFLHTSNTNSRTDRYGLGWKLLDNTLLAQQTQTYFRQRCSGNGQVLIIPDMVNNTYISFDYGKSYSNAQVHGGGINACSISENGKYAILYNNNNSNYIPVDMYSLYNKSVDGYPTLIGPYINASFHIEDRVGVSQLGSITVCDVSVSPSGKFALMAGSASDKGRLYLLTNYGSNASGDFVNLGYGQWSACCIGANENSLVAVKDNRYIYGTSNLSAILNNPINADVLAETDTSRNGITLNLLADVWNLDLVSSATSIRWVKCSSDGRVIMVGSNWTGAKTNIIISQDYGKSFDTVGTPNLNHYDIAMSSTGMYMATICYESGNSDSGLYVSSDYGSTWTKANLPANTTTTSFYGVCMSSDGTHIYVLERNTAYAGGYQNYANKIYYYNSNWLTFETNSTKLDYPVVGSAYFNNSTLYIHNGSTWVQINNWV